MVLPDDAVAHGKSQAGALGAFGGEKRIENVGQNLLLNAGPGVPDLQDEIVALRS